MSDDGKLIPFRPVPRRHRTARPAADNAADGRRRYAQALIQQAAQRLIATGRPVPARITTALDACGLEGPEVDTACGAAEPDVDMWECGLAVPTAEQVRLLAKLTGFPVHYFYLPIKPGPQIGPITVCYRGRRGCESVPADVIDEHGVLHYGGVPREMPPNVQGALF